MNYAARVRGLALVLVLGLALGLASRLAEAGEPIVVATPDIGFRDALSDALAPAGMEIKAADDAPPDTIANIQGASRALADREGASATVWLVLASDGTTLVVYDRGVDRILIRSLPYTQVLTAAQAAEAARMTRTMLRALRVTPDLDLQPPSAIEAPAVRARAATPIVQPIVTPQSAVLAIDVDGGARVRGPGTTLAPTAALSAIWRPQRLGLAVAVRLAPAADVREAMVVGRISDQSLAVLARLPLQAGPAITLAGTAGVALHLVELDGELADTPLHHRGFDPAARVGLTATYALRPTIGIGLAVSADCLLRRQSYVADVESVLDVPWVQGAAGIVVTARIL